MLNCILTAFLICMFLSGCSGNPSAVLSGKNVTASQELEDLFTTVDLMDATISDLQREMEECHVTSEQLTQMYIDRIEAYDEELKLNSIIFINPEALKEAKELDKERSEGKVRGPLHGIPIVVKANCEVAGLPVTAGSNSLANMVATEDSFVVKQLKEAGTVILAHANMSEFAQAAGTSRSTLGGYVHNAYDTNRAPGGSSGGTAVAVTCNFAAAGIGTDTGGSIRNPSSFNDIYGIKPSKGLTSISGVIPLKAYRDTTGPMARTAEDAALLLEIMAGTDLADDYTLEADADSLLGDGYVNSLSADALKGIRIGYLDSSFQYTVADEDGSSYDLVDARVNVNLEKTIANLRKAGADFVDLSEKLPGKKIEKISESISTDTFIYDISKYLHDKGNASPFKTFKELLKSGIGIMHMNLGMLLSDADDLPDSFEELENPYTEKYGTYNRIPEWKTMLKDRTLVEKIMKDNDVDAIMFMNFFDLPGKEDVIMELRYNKAAYDITFGSKLGLPEIVLPMGFSETAEDPATEMPLGLSLFSGFGQDETLLRIAYAYEQQAGDSVRRMPEVTPALEDTRLNTYLTELIDKAYTISSSKYSSKLEGKVQLMLNACQKAMEVDTKDPCATYEAARNLAEAYDKVAGY